MFYFYIIVIAFILLKMKNGCFLLRVWFCCDCKRRVISNDTVVLFLLFTYFMFCHNVTICQVFSVSKLQLFDEAIYRLIVYFTFHCSFTSEIANIIAGEKKLNNSNERNVSGSIQIVLP